LEGSCFRFFSLLQRPSRALLLVNPGNDLLDLLLSSRIKRLDEAVLRLDIRVAQSLVEPMRSGSGRTRPQPHDYTPLFPGPLFGVLHQLSPDAFQPVSPINHQAFDRDELFGFNGLCDYRMNPSGKRAINFGNDELLIRSRKDAREPGRRCGRIDIVPKLRCEIPYTFSVGLLRYSYGKSHVV
jgi:hypothetical protein